MTKLYAQNMPLSIKSCELIVKDLGIMSTYYQNVIGLTVLEKTVNRCVLGTAAQPLIYLTHQPNAKQNTPHDAGLFHIAFLLPTRQHLAQYLKFADEQNIMVSGASDHLVSEAIYMNDPEGNGIEIYVDRQRDEWPMDADGFVMDTIRLNVPSLMAELHDTKWNGMPDNGCIGHVHLQVSDLKQSDEFYRGVLDMGIKETYHSALFLSAGDYHHHIAINTWNSRGAGRRTENQTGITRIIMQAANHDMINRIKQDKHSAQTTDAALSFIDPSGINIDIHVGA